MGVYTLEVFFSCWKFIGKYGKLALAYMKCVGTKHFLSIFLLKWEHNEVLLLVRSLNVRPKEK